MAKDIKSNKPLVESPCEQQFARVVSRLLSGLFAPVRRCVRFLKQRRVCTRFRL